MASGFRSPQPWTALAIEPDRLRLPILTDHLRELGCGEVVACPDAETGFDHLRTLRPRIIFCAARIRPMDGFQFVYRFRRSLEVRNQETPIILTFAGVDRVEVAAAIDAGADAVLSYPVSLAQVSHLLQMLDAQKRPFIRASTYVGPCRRRGPMPGIFGRRLEDYGAPEALEALKLKLERVYEVAQREPVAPEWVETCATALVDYLCTARPGGTIDVAALRIQCEALVRQYSEHAFGQKTFDHAFAPVRRFLTTVMLRDSVRRSA